jgi:hypothetical protein
VRDRPLVNESTPKERLKKYKESLAKLALLEGRELKLSNPVKDSEVDAPAKEGSSHVPARQEPAENIRPPQVLVSPSKRELRESMAFSKKKGNEFKADLSLNSERSRILLKAREKAIDSALADIKNRRSMIELQLKKKTISKDEYERRIRSLVEEGHRLLKEKSEVDKALAK